MISLINVSLRYGKGVPVLENINIEIAAGSFHFLTGESGAGKTSLLRLLHMGIRSNSGLVKLFGKRVSTLGRKERILLRRRIGFVFQDFRLLGHLSVFENAALPLKARGVSESKIRRQVSELLTWVGLGDQLEVYPETLSGGEQQRVAVVRAVVGSPQLLLADEPTGSVDDKNARRLFYLFEQMHKTGTSMILATHNEELIRRYDYPVIRLSGGRAVSYYTPVRSQWV